MLRLNRKRYRRSGHLLAALIGAVVVLAAIPAGALAAPGAPAGVTGIALDAKVQVAWKTVSGATSYSVYRGSSVGAVNTRIANGLSSSTTNYTDSTAVNGTKYFYAVTGSDALGESAKSSVVSATPAARSCSTGNAIKLENCFPGTTSWKSTDTADFFNDGLEGYATATSVNVGSSVDIKVRADVDTPYHIDIYRTGSYGGSGGRLISSIVGLKAVYQQPCDGDTSTGLTDCSNWDVTSTIATTSNWVSGVYLLRLVRDDNGKANEILLVVRDDSSHSDILFQVPTNTYQAYNEEGGKSLYDNSSSGANTVAGTPRAVRVSNDRPYFQPGKQIIYDWYTNVDVQYVAWLEANGYDASYYTDLDLQTNAQLPKNHKVVMTGSHSEYWSKEMRDNLTAARDAGVSLFFGGTNTIYWKVRFIASPYSGAANRVMVCYKTTQSGPVDPSGIPTGTWRDPNATNQPENKLIGGMYIGEANEFFPLVVAANQDTDRFWRHTPVYGAAGSSTIGTSIVGWEWDAVVNNGQTPAGTTTLSASPVSGNLLTNYANNTYTVGSSIAQATRYQAASGAVVFYAATGQWDRGLGPNIYGVTDANQTIQQATVNMLSDMGTLPTTPSGGLVVDPTGPPALTTRTPAVGATGVPTNTTVTATFDRGLDPSTVTTTNVKLTDPTGTNVPATVTYSDTTNKATLDPNANLLSNTTYTATLTTGIKAWSGQGLAAASTWTFKTANVAPQVTARTPASGATSVSVATTVTATFDNPLDASTVTTANVKLTDPSSTVVPATVSYDSTARKITLTPNAALAGSTAYTATVTTAVRGADGTSLAADEVWSFTTSPPVQITSTSPPSGATGISPTAVVRAVFSRDMDPTTVNTTTFKLAQGATAVTGSVGYDAATRTATFTPSATLTATSSFTATVTTGAKAADGGLLSAPVSWSFTTASSSSSPPTVTGVTPANGATNVAVSSVATATFSRALDTNTVTGGNAYLTAPGGTTVAAVVSYTTASNKINVSPSANLAPGTLYTGHLSTGIRAADGTALAADYTWSFTTADICPCNLMGTSTPALTGLPTQDGRTGTGPWSYEMGTKFQVTAQMNFYAFRFYKSSGENGTHVGTLWSSTGSVLAQATFANESASGWQQQNLALPVTLTANTTYTTSVGLNNYFVATGGGLNTQLTNGPLQSIVGSNGVYGNSAGTFPTNSYNNGNYYVDPAVRSTSAPNNAPTVTGTTPASGAASVAASATPTATFSTALDASTVNAQSYTLTPSGGSAVAATVSYSGTNNTATLTPSAPLASGTTYTARLSTAVNSSDGTPMASAYTWTFTTAVVASAPTVTSTSPSNGATGISTATPVSATFSADMNASTISGSTFTLTGPGGAVAASVAYNAASRTATLTPSSALAASTTYTANLTTGVKGTNGMALTSAFTWTFTTLVACPCNLMGTTTPTAGPYDTRDGRGGTGPWTYELGTKIKVTQTANLTAIRFYKASNETGTHVGTLWSSSGTVLGTVTFTGETASGWQQATLSTPVTLQPGNTYTVSVGFNSYFMLTGGGLANQLSAGPLQSVADGLNGVYGAASGTFPTSSWNSSNYFVDAVVG